MEDSNIDEIARWLDDITGTFGFDTTGATGQSLGEEVAHAVSAKISEDCRNGIAPDGSSWDDVRDPYKAWKEAKFGGQPTGYATGETLSEKALVGEVRVEHDRVTMTHGTGAVGRDGASDRDKGRWLSEGCGTDSRGRKQNRPKRRFYLLNAERKSKAMEVLVEGLRRHVERKAGSL